MKIYILLIALIVCSAPVFSQPVSIELSIEWKNADTASFRKFGLPYHAFLTLTYRNLSDDSLYFPKMYDDDNNVPKFGSQMPFTGSEKKLEEYLYNKTVGEDYHVFMGLSSQFYFKTWDMYPDSISVLFLQGKEIVDEIMDDPNDFYTRLWKARKTDPKNGFAESDMNPQKIEHMRTKFVFLLSGEEYTESFNLVGFQFLGGNYLFLTGTDSISSSVYITWDEKRNCVAHPYYTKELPEQVGKYKLYSGPFLSNEVSVKFVNRKKK